MIGTGWLGSNPALREVYASLQDLTDPVPQEFAREFQASTAYAPLPETFFDEIVSESLKLPARVWKAVLAGLLDMPTAPAQLQAHVQGITCPVSIFWGDRDAIFGEADQQALMRLFPQARLEVFEEVGHALHWEVPDEFVKQLSRVIR